MRVLLTNDDGLHAPGIRALYRALVGIGEVLTVAPSTVQSGTGHGITFDEPLMCEEIAFAGDATGIAVEGRPADCVKLALRAIWGERFGEGSRPDLTISGMNMGANVGINVLYSGTVGAAVESAFLGVPAIAVSLELGDRQRTEYDRAAQIARQVIDRLLTHPLDQHDVINVNLPRIENAAQEVPELRVVPMNIAAGLDGYERRTSPEGQVYYWPVGDGMSFAHTAPGCDVEAIAQGRIAVTPLSYDLTDHPRAAAWREAMEPAR